MGKLNSIREVGMELAKKMPEAEKGAFFYKVMNCLKLEKRAELRHLILMRAQRYKLIEKFNPEAIDNDLNTLDYDYYSKKITLFLIETLQNKNEENNKKK
ncbi:MAG: hypothetical protein ACRDD2_09700 [Sarcina sp.]